MSSKINSDDREVLSGLVERVVFHNPENGFSVLTVQARGIRDPQAVVGRAPSVNRGEWITASGQWVNNRLHGHQFEASYIETSEPTSQEGVEKYLASGAIPGIGPVYAHKLVDEFGDKVFDVIASEPQRLHEVPGIGPVRANRIIAAWEEQKVVREIMVFLHDRGLGTARANRIFKVYGADAPEIITENPYRLARDFRGIGFASADQVASRQGFEKDDERRVRAGIGHTLTEATKDGHCGLPRDELLSRGSKLLEVRPELVESALDQELREKEPTVVQDRTAEVPCIFLKHLHLAERGIARALGRLVQGVPPWPPIDVDRAIPWVERKLGLTLAQSQAAAVRTAIRSKVMVITGGPGVGKTTIVKAILGILMAKGTGISLCAPTGRAARRLSETVGQDAKTIHRLLEFDPRRGRFRRNEHEPLECDLLVVDETSMVDVPLMHSLLRALPGEAALLAVGDVDQLPSVGPGQVLSDLIESGAVRVARLVEVFRQAATSRIVVNAHRINRGEMPDLGRPEGETDFYFVPAETPDDATRKIVELVRNRIPKRFGLDPVRDIQVLCPMNRGGVGSRALNLELQAVLNPGNEDKAERLGWTYSSGDKVMQIENDYDKEVYNGDIGLIDSLDVDLEHLQVEFDGRKVDYSFKELDALVPAYATTIHKSQGSEYPAVVLPIMKRHFVMLQRNLIYTGITRARRLVVVLGQPGAVRQAVQTVSQSVRWSNLRELVRSACATGAGSAEC